MLMKRVLLLAAAILLSTINTNILSAQNMHAKPGMGEGKFNYTSFTQIVPDRGLEAIAGNKGYENDPELGMKFKESPCQDCYEAIGKRTETTKTYVRKGTNGKGIYVQTSTAPMHYKDGSGRWRTIKSWLAPATGKQGVYSADDQPVPVINDAGKGYSSLGKTGEQIRFNNRLELLYEQPDGTVTSLGTANWANHTAGNDGVYVTNAWPGIDIELRTMRGAVKTNYWINHSLPQYANGKLLVRDHLEMDEGLSLFSGGQKRYTGIMEIRDKKQEKLYVISTATAFEKNDGVNTLRNLAYLVGNDNTLDIELPGDFLNRPAAAYPVIIDPLVSLGTSVAVAGSTYSPGWTVGCPILNPATVPADLTITDIQFTFEYLASGGALQTNGALDFYLGACRNPALTGWYWYCLVFTPGPCGGANISLLPDFVPCIPPVNCASYNLNVTMNFYQSYLAVAPCSNLYITATQPLIITVVGQTLKSTISPSSSAICLGATTTMTGSASYGSPPYSYTWYPGVLSGPTLAVSPAATTTYSLVVTDACGFTDTATSTITVNPVAPITGNTSFCIGSTALLSNAVGGGTWSSNNLSVATVGSTSGIVSGAAPGVAVITYTTTAGCVSTTTVNIVSSASPITGLASVCQGASTALSNIAPGGTWSSNFPSIATVDPFSGIVTGVSAGTAVITYTVSAGCFSILPLPVFPAPVISGTASADPTTCVSLDGSITLSGLTPGDSYTVNYDFNGSPVSATIVANPAGQIVITGLDGGSYTNIIVTSTLGCVSNTVAGPIALNFPPSPATPVVTNNGPFCAGNNLILTANSTTPGVTYSWTGPNGYTSSLQNPVISPAFTVNAGIYLVTATKFGCVSTPGPTVAVIHPVPFITAFASANPTNCFGTDGTIILSGLLPGVSYSVDYTYNGGTVTATLSADPSGNVTIPGLSAGMFTSISVSSFGCPSNVIAAVTLLDPGAPPVPVISTNSPICDGKTLALFAHDSVAALAYSWAGPNGFVSTLQNPLIANATVADAGLYTVTVSNGACNSSATSVVVLYPAPTLTAVTVSQSVTFGTAIQLSASGALYYTWSPDNGTLTNPNISNPVARPLDKTTYIVAGMNEWGCTDTALVTIDINYIDTVLVPTAFSPNGDGYNDVFRIVNVKDCKLVAFDIYNRWGQLVFHNDYNIRQGWDGTFNGVPMDMGVYNYLIILSKANGDNVVYKGDVTLVR